MPRCRLAVLEGLEAARLRFRLGAMPHHLIAAQNESIFYNLL